MKNELRDRLGLFLKERNGQLRIKIQDDQRMNNFLFLAFEGFCICEEAAALKICETWALILALINFWFYYISEKQFFDIL